MMRGANSSLCICNCMLGVREHHVHEHTDTEFILTYALQVARSACEPMLACVEHLPHVMSCSVKSNAGTSMR